jgi:hypothetical protein
MALSMIDCRRQPSPPVALAINNLLDEDAYSFFLHPSRSAAAELDFSF